MGSPISYSTSKTWDICGRIRHGHTNVKDSLTTRTADKVKKSGPKSAVTSAVQNTMVLVHEYLH